MSKVLAKVFSIIAEIAACVCLYFAWVSEPVPGRELHPPKARAFSRRTFSPTAGTPLTVEFLNYNQVRCCGMDAALKIVTHLPLRELWRDDGLKPRHGSDRSPKMPSAACSDLGIFSSSL
jgi:hypothetical protein